MWVWVGSGAKYMSVRGLKIRRNGDANSQAMNVTAKRPLTPDQLSKITFSGVNFSPSSEVGAPNVQVHLNAEQPMVLSGNVEDNSDIRGVLTYVVEKDRKSVV